MNELKTLNKDTKKLVQMASKEILKEFEKFSDKCLGIFQNCF